MKISLSLKSLASTSRKKADNSGYETKPSSRNEDCGHNDDEDQSAIYKETIASI